MNPALSIGFPAALATYLIWGSLPLYVRAMQHVAAADLLAHRVIWSLPTAILLIGAAAKWRDVRKAFSPRRLRWLAISGLLIGANWAIYIGAVNAGRTLEASLGYYINPLVNVLLGRLIFSERLGRLQWVAVMAAAAGVAIMAAAFGHVPWIALALCLTFALYSLIRKQVEIDSRAGFLAEVAILAPIAACWLAWFAQPPVMGAGVQDTLLLLAAGPITAVPLILFALAARRLRLSTIGMMQYIGPTLQFLIAIFIFREGFSQTHALAFGFIWLAIILFTIPGMLGDLKTGHAAAAKKTAP